MLKARTPKNPLVWGIKALAFGSCSVRDISAAMGTPGSPQLMQRLVDEQYVALYRYAFRLSGSAADAEDLTQEAFCKAQANLGQPAARSGTSQALAL